MDLLPVVHPEAVSEDGVGALTEDEASKDNHGIVVDHAGVLVSGVRKVAIIVIQSLWLD
jgi:hypothetical protein